MNDTMTLAAACALATAMLGGESALAATQVYTATLVPMNAQAAKGEVRGEVRVTVSGPEVTFAIRAEGLSPSMMHMAHLHGFASDRSATCPGAQADVNHDGVVDLLETEPTSGVTMMPFNAHPAALKIASDTYPVAAKDGSLAYHRQFSLAQLASAMSTEFPGQSPSFASRVVFVHGIAPGTHLPKTVASLPGVPAQATIPIACGRLVPAS